MSRDRRRRSARHADIASRPVARNQTISFELARTEARAMTARAAYYAAAAEMLAGLPFEEEAADSAVPTSTAA